MAIASGLLAGVAPAHATPCPADASRNRVELQVADDADLAPALVDRVEAHLRVELAPDDVLVCRSPVSATGDGDATFIRVSRTDQNELRVSVQRRPDPPLVRQLEFGSVPASGRALALAIAATELARASRTRAPVAATIAAPIVVEQASPAPIADHVALAIELGGRALAQVDGTAAAGPSLALVGQWSPRLGSSIEAGLRWAAPIASSSGSTDVSAVVAGAGLRCLLTRPGATASVAAIARFEAAAVSAAGRADAGAAAHQGRALGVAAWAGSLGQLALGRLRLGLELAAGHAVRAVAVADGGSVAGGLRGLAFAATLLVGAPL